MPDEDAFVRSILRALGKTFLKPEFILTQKGAILRLSERELFHVSVCYGVKKKQGETVYGDSVMHLHTDDGRIVTMLSDGVFDAGEDSWLEPMMQDSKRQNAQELTAGIIARASDSGVKDDISAIVINLIKNTDKGRAKGNKELLPQRAA